MEIDQFETFHTDEIQRIQLNAAATKANIFKSIRTLFAIFEKFGNAIAKRFIHIVCFNDAKWTIATDELVSQVQNSHCHFEWQLYSLFIINWCIGDDDDHNSIPVKKFHRTKDAFSTYFASFMDDCNSHDSNFQIKKFRLFY